MKLKTTKNLLLAGILTLGYSVNSQSVEIQGQAKVTEMTNDNEVDDIVVRKSDGTLATRSAQSLPSSFIDTTRTINTDFELAKHICECGTNLPPYLIESLLSAGYSEEDLISAGIPFANLKETINTVTDVDGNVYDIITIGTQKWLKQSLRVTKYNDGTPIEVRLSNADWEQSIEDEEPAYSYPNGDINLATTYGYLYSSYTVLDSYNGLKNVCPAGWTVPKNTDNLTLISYLDPDGVNLDNDAGIYLKATGTDEWANPNVGANNLTGFQGLPSGLRTRFGSYSSVGTIGLYHTKETSSTTIIYSFLSNNTEEFNVNNTSFQDGGFAIRCIKE